MRFTDTFIKRPVLAIVLALFVLLLGMKSIGQIRFASSRNPNKP